MNFCYEAFFYNFRQTLRYFYCNSKTGETAWEVPEIPEEESVATVQEPPKQKVKKKKTRSERNKSSIGNFSLTVYV